MAKVKVKKRGLYANIHAKRKRIKAGSGEKMRKPGSKGAPTKKEFIKSKDKYALIFEDDAQVDSKFLEIIMKIQIYDNLNLDLLQLGYLKDRNGEKNNYE
jgi:hypothetical protein